jgi:hypothetical protein
VQGTGYRFNLVRPARVGISFIGAARVGCKKIRHRELTLDRSA